MDFGNFGVCYMHSMLNNGYIFWAFLQMMSKRGKRRSFRFSNPWFESWSRNTRQHGRKGIKIGGSYDPQKNKDLFQRYNYKGMHLPFEVGLHVENQSI